MLTPDAAYDRLVTSLGTDQSAIRVVYELAANLADEEIRRRAHAIGNRLESHDLADEIVIPILEKTRSGAARPIDSLRAYLRTSVRNRLNTHWRRSQRERSLETPLSPTDPDGPSIGDLLAADADSTREDEQAFSRIQDLVVSHALLALRNRDQTAEKRRDYIRAFAIAASEETRTRFLREDGMGGDLSNDQRRALRNRFDKQQERARRDVIAAFDSVAETHPNDRELLFEVRRTYFLGSAVRSRPRPVSKAKNQP